MFNNLHLSFEKRIDFIEFLLRSASIEIKSGVENAQELPLIKTSILIDFSSRISKIEIREMGQSYDVSRYTPRGEKQKDYHLINRTQAGIDAITMFAREEKSNRIENVRAKLTEYIPDEFILETGWTNDPEITLFKKI